jgi:hypothetical protein
MLQNPRDSSLLDEGPSIVDTSNDRVKCTKLPDFIRAKKRLYFPFEVYFEKGLVQDGCIVKLNASSKKNPGGELKNNVAAVSNGKATFEDLRFLGKSGRGGF